MNKEELTILKQLVYQQNYMNKKLDEILNKIDAVDYHTTDLTKFTREDELVIEKMVNDLGYYEETTSENWNDIEM